MHPNLTPSDYLVLQKVLIDWLAEHTKSPWRGKVDEIKDVLEDWSAENPTG